MTERERLLRRISGGELPRKSHEFPDDPRQFCVMQDDAQVCLDCGHLKGGVTTREKCTHPKREEPCEFPKCIKTCPMSTDY